MSEINDIEESPEGNFPINKKFIQKYQQTDHSIRTKYKYGTYHNFCVGSNIDLKPIM